MKIKTAIIGSGSGTAIRYALMKESNNIIIVDNCPRDPLGEGRSVGMAFAALKETNINHYETISPFSPCKDYLNDVLYTEHTGVTMGACGLKTLPKQGILDNSCLYLGIKFLNRKGDNNKEYEMSLSYSNEANSKITRARHIEFYTKNLDFCNRILTEANLELGLRFTSELVPTKEEGEFLLILPIQYAHSTYLISLITGLVRSLVLKRLVNVDDNVDFLTFLREISKIPSIEQQIISKIYKVFRKTLSKQQNKSAQI